MTHKLTRRFVNDSSEVLLWVACLDGRKARVAATASAVMSWKPWLTKQLDRPSAGLTWSTSCGTGHGEHGQRHRCNLLQFLSYLLLGLMGTKLCLACLKEDYLWRRQSQQKTYRVLVPYLSSVWSLGSLEASIKSCAKRKAVSEYFPYPNIQADAANSRI